MKTLSVVNTVLFILEILLLILGQIGRVTLAGGFSFYALEIFVIVHVVTKSIDRLILFERNGVESRTIKNDFSISQMQALLRSKSKLLISTVRKSRTIQLATLWIIFCIVVLTTQSPQFSPNENVRAFGYLLRIVNFALYALIVVPSISKKMVENALDALSFVVPLLALVQYIFMPDLRFLAAFGWDPHMYRAVGTIFDPPIMGSILGMLFVYKNMKVKKYKNNVLDTITLILLYFSIIFLYSRSTYLAVIITSSAILFLKRKYFLLFYFCTFFLLSIYLAPRTIPAYERLESAKIERLSTVTSRQTEILAGLTAFAKNPIWGIGYNRVREYKEKLTVNSEQLTVVGEKNIFRNQNSNNSTKSIEYRVSSIKTANHAGSAYHSFWVTQLATTGVIGFGLLLWFFAEIVRKKLWFAPIFFIPAFIGLFDNTIFHPFVMLTALVIYSVELKKEYE